jgi:HEAT repeat protein
VTIAAGIFACLATLAAPQDEKNLQSAIQKFKDDYYKVGAKEDEKIAAVNYLSQHRHERIVRVLSPLLSEAPPAVRMIAARALSNFHDVDLAGRELMNALQAGANSGKKQSCVRIEILRALGALHYRGAGSVAAKLVQDREVWVAKAAIDATGHIRVSDAIAPLIKALSRIEGKEGDSEVSVDPLDSLIEGYGKNDLFKQDARLAKRPSERELLRAPILAALQSITKQSFASGKEWEAWWSKNKSTFAVVD